MHRLLFSLILILQTIAGNSQGFSFFRESITMKITEKAFYVTGIYYLKDHPGKSRVLINPYPANSDLGNVDSVNIYNLSSNKAIIPKKNNNKGTLFTVEFGPDSILMIQISYKQALLGMHAEYILTTTRNWGKPLQQANYQVIVPYELHISRFSIPPQDSTISEKETIYYWEKSNYLPSVDLRFDFSKR
jgi:hypothetical protein